MTTAADLAAIGLKRLRFRPRHGRCFELTYKMIMAALDDSAWRLVHGTVESPALGQVSHAWLSGADRVYDPSFDQIWDSDNYASVLDAAATALYDRTEAAKMAAAHGHFGPWIELDG